MFAIDKPLLEKSENNFNDKSSHKVLSSEMAIIPSKNGLSHLTANSHTI